MMIPISREDEARMEMVEEFLADLLKKYQGKALTRVNLVSMQVDLNEIVKMCLPIFVEDGGILYELSAYTFKITEEKKVAVVAKLKENNLGFVGFFNREKAKGE